MLYSMTGFGRKEVTIGDKTFLIEIKSLNGKQFDLNFRFPAILKPKEVDLRNHISSLVIRGSVDCFISLKDTGSAKPVTINTSLIRAYYHALKELGEELNIDSSQLLPALLKLPEVVTPASDAIIEQDFEQLTNAISQVVQQLMQHRADEGAVLREDLTLRIKNIETRSAMVQELEPRRKELVKENIEKILAEYVGKDAIDRQRLEQELVYYTEKIDIHEETVRLKTHCEYFFEILNNTAEISKGKKLSFVLQEIGREINTTGSKAYDAGIQRLVVEMKDELEKAKEQVLNIL
jgi:uncharacterized protein (TIGR00255 family)